MIFWYFLTTIISLCVGSFLNVVIYRLPIILEQQWREECTELLSIPAATSSTKYSLALPSSHCDHCKKPLRWYHNIPLLSFIWLKARCAYCQQPISYRYPSIELLSAITSLFLLWHFGLTPAFFSSVLFSWLLITLIFIDIDQQLLPDLLTYSLLWLGLFASIFSVFIDPISSILGALIGYLSLWLIAHLYQLFTGREGMGFGDFKLLAALGAWVGWQGLTFVILIGSGLGTIIGLYLLFKKQQGARTPLAFGPYLAIAGWIVLIWSKSFLNLFF